MALRSDRELLKLLGLTEQAVASLLHKSRQTLNIGLLRTDQYLRSDELGRLLAYCETNNPASAKIAAEYVRATRDASDASDALQMGELFAAKNRFLTSETILATGEAWITLPDFRYFKTTYADTLAVIAERARAGLDTFKVVVSVQRDADQFFNYIDVDPAKARSSAMVSSEVDAWPYTLLLEPRAGSPTGWVRVTGGFQMIDGMRTEGMLAVLARYIPVIGKTVRVATAGAGRTSGRQAIAPQNLEVVDARSSNSATEITKKTQEHVSDTKKLRAEAS